MELNSNSIVEITGQIEKLVTDRMDQIAITAHNLISIRTPEDTGQAQAGWNFTLNKIDTRTPPEPPKGTGRLPVQESEPDQRATKATDSYFLANSVDHVIYLNEGHSQKAPEKFIEIETAKAVDIVGGGAN
tara:strand:- start:731 stop:1123 length:393 start_codon:yes stop_codon:yes gene_type:complete